MARRRLGRGTHDAFVHRAEWIDSVMMKTRGVWSEMSQEARLEDVPLMFTFRPWNPHVESWDDFKHAAERAYSQYLDRCRRKISADQTGHDLERKKPDPEDSR
jgi:hypothetical protein